MPRILMTSGPGEWRRLLADADKQWKPGYSACTLASCWEAADGFPAEVSEAFARATEPLLSNTTPLLAVPEFKVPLPGGSRASQNDVFVLARSSAGLVCIMVEGKVNESFGPTLHEWQTESPSDKKRIDSPGKRRIDSPGKKKRLNFLLRTLCIAEPPSGDLRYQLFHRAASAIITGDQYRAVAAVLLVHSFSQKRTGWGDYKAFIRLFGVEAVADGVQHLPSATSVPLFSAWVTGDCSFLNS